MSRPILAYDICYSALDAINPRHATASS